MNLTTAATIPPSPSPTSHITFAAIRGAIPPQCFQRSTAKGLLAFVVAISVYGVVSVALYFATTWWMLVVLAIARGLTIGPVFVVGHDACHDALTPSMRLNRWLGQIAFLPTWHSFTSWRYGHNFVHHQHTQILEKDSAYPPMSPEEYACAPWMRKLVHRLSRTPLGAGALYFPVWLEYQAFPNAQMRERTRLAGTTFGAEQVLVAVWIMAEICLFSGVFARFIGFPTPNFSPIPMLFCSILITHFVWHWQMGFITFLHHFHPEVPWHSEADAPPAAQRQIESTVHMMFPAGTHWSMLNILEHTAHHAVTQIPLYNLPKAQAMLNLAFADEIRREPMRLSAVLRAFRVCKLWNQKTRAWEPYP